MGGVHSERRFFNSVGDSPDLYLFFKELTAHFLKIKEKIHRDTPKNTQFHFSLVETVLAEKQYLLELNPQ